MCASFLESMKIIRPLLQEIYQDDPWKMLVCCILLNLCRRTTVDKVRQELFKRYPTPQNIIEAKEKEIADLLEPLGFYNKRAKTLQKMSEGYLKGFKDVTELYGIGRYAKDSWELFQNNNRNINPTDKVLTEYLKIT